MPHLWYTKDTEWIAESLSAERPLRDWTGDGATIVHVRTANAGQGAYALLDAAGSVRINGEAVSTGIRVLRDRDEILCGDGRRLWFSAERLAELTVFAGSEYEGGAVEAPRCPRCREAILEDSAAVACPTCGVFYHQRPDRKCYELHDQCVICSGPTQPLAEATLGWTPCAL